MIKIKNKEYKFKFGFRAILLFEEETGQPIAELGENIKMADVVDIAYCGMKSAGEKITKDFIIDAIDEDMSAKFLKATKRLLAPEGHALFVVNTFIPLEKKALKYFRSVQALANNGSFKLIALRN